MATRVATKVIDGDGHIMEDLEGIFAHMASPYREIASGRGLFPPLDHLHDGRAVETPPTRDGRPRVGPQGWLAFLDDVGIEQTVLYPTTALAYGKIVSLDYAVAVTRAYNDWLFHTYLQVDSRFKGMAIIPMQDPEEAVKELRRAVTELGMLGGMMPSNGLPTPLGAKQYWPVYAEAERLGCTLAVQGGIAWLLLCLERFHSSHETHFQYMPLDQFGPREGEHPDEYIKKHIDEGRFYIGCETEELTLPFALQVVGNAPFIYSSDFPHEVTTESCKHDIGELMESDDLTQADKEAILYRNAERFYRL